MGYKEMKKYQIRPRIIHHVSIFRLQVGQKVMKGCCKTLKPVVLELGGKDPFIVCDDANIEALMPFIMKGSFFNAGQNCIGVERVFVYEKVGCVADLLRSFHHTPTNSGEGGGGFHFCFVVCLLLFSFCSVFGVSGRAAQ